MTLLISYQFSMVRHMWTPYQWLMDETNAINTSTISRTNHWISCINNGILEIMYIWDKTKDNFPSCIFFLVNWELNLKFIYFRLKVSSIIFDVLRRPRSTAGRVADEGTDATSSVMVKLEPELGLIRFQVILLQNSHPSDAGAVCQLMS